MSETTASVVVLRRALDQTGDLVAAVHEGHLDRPTPCADWTVRQLVAHVLAAPGRFLEMSRGGEVDWSSDPAPPETGWAEAFREDADYLIHYWHEQGQDAGTADWQTAEFAVHSWDLSRGLGKPDDQLDAEVAERALAFMKQGLTDQNRGEVFGPPVTVADDAPPYTRLAAWAGRDPG